MTLIPDGPQALRNLADTLEQQAAGYDRVLWRRGGERSTMAEALRLSASLARQQAHRLERLAEQLSDAKGGTR